MGQNIGNTLFSQGYTFGWVWAASGRPGRAALKLKVSGSRWPRSRLANQSRGSGLRWSTVILEGAKGNPTGIGARITIETSEGRKLVREVRAGGSYLAQSTARQFVALGKNEWVAGVSVRWPTGQQSEETLTGFENRLRIRHP